MTTSEARAEPPQDVPGPTAAPTTRHRVVGLVLLGIVAAVVLVALGFGVGRFSRQSAEPDRTQLRRIQRALAVLAAVRVVLSAVRREVPEGRLAAAQLIERCPAFVPRATRAAVVHHEL